jgi:methyltransferase
LIGAIALLAYITAERAAEPLIAARNDKGLLARGGVVHAEPLFPLILALHVAWLAGLWWLAWERPMHPAWLAVFVILQGLRFWVMAALGRRWTTRIITVPGETLVRTGPYRFLKHPNYWVVVGEIAVLPLVFGLPLFAAVFSALNAVALFIRVGIENRALASLR